jgi:putative Mg2+ transporter-C (MgtC) family protein
MDGLYTDIAGRLLGALALGGLIGLERSYHGRPAGFRTHALVCTASALLMLVTVYEGHWFAARGAERVTIDPTRMAQGIMTGIGFLGAGVIMKEGLSVRGLTTAASIWITAAIGVLVGIGFWFPGIFATAIALGTLALFRMIESRMPTQYHAYFTVAFARAGDMTEAQLRALLAEHGFTVANLSYRLADAGARFEYRMTLRTLDAANAGALSDALKQLPSVAQFRISPVGD